ncbi:MAG: hypothetical protein ACR2QO_09570 [Acidimicrobiales bacterium]
MSETITVELVGGDSGTSFVEGAQVLVPLVVALLGPPLGLYFGRRHEARARTAEFRKLEAQHENALDQLRAKHQADVGELTRQRDAELIESAMTEAAIVLQHVFVVEDNWRRGHLIEHDVPNGLGPDGLPNELKKLRTELTASEFYGIDVNDFHLHRHRLLLLAHQVRNRRLREGLIEFHGRSKEILGFSESAQGLSVRTDLEDRYADLMERAGKLQRTSIERS